MINCEICSARDEKLHCVSPNDTNYLLACGDCLSKIDSWAAAKFPGEISLYDGADNVVWRREGTNVPKAIFEQAVTISVSGEDVKIDCDCPDEASEIFEWLIRLIGKKYA